MTDTPSRPGSDEPTQEFEPLSQVSAEPSVPDAADEVPGTSEADSGRFTRTWFWMILVSSFGLFLVFGSVRAHYWKENAAGTYYVPTQKAMKVLDIWRAQVNGLPDVAHQSILKGVFLFSVFAFIGLAVIGLWLASVEIWTQVPSPKTDRDDSGRRNDGPGEVGVVPELNAG